MALGALLYGLIATAAGLLASNAATEFGKGAGKAAFEALKAWLASRHAVAGLDAIDEAGAKPEVAERLRSELDAPAIAGDPEVARLAEALRAALAAIPPAETAVYAVDIRQGIEAARDITLEDIEGLRAESLKAGQDLTLRNIKAPPGKP
jgi:hypothetical protein